MKIKTRTPDEIAKKIDEVEDSDFFGTITNDLVECLPFDVARSRLKPEVSAEDWATHQKLSDPLSVKERIIDYLPFAWEKANNCRGLSAARSLDHMKAWFWLLGFDIPVNDYSHFGKPQLRAISEALGFDWSTHDDGNWTNEEGGRGRALASASLGLPDLTCVTAE